MGREQPVERLFLAGAEPFEDQSVLRRPRGRRESIKATEISRERGRERETKAQAPDDRAKQSKQALAVE